MSSTESTSLQVLTASDLPQRLTAALAEGRHGSQARARMSPAMSYGRHAGPAPHTARHAAVLLLLFRRNQSVAGSCGWYVPLTERPATLARHAGQISLPGGAVEPGETSSQAALRELSEELGIKGEVEILGRLAGCYVFASDFLVTPWIGFCSYEPQWKPHDCEVQDVVELPLEALFDERHFGQVTVDRGPLQIHAPCIQINDACIWGATSVILAELGDILQQLNTNEEF